MVKGLKILIDTNNTTEFLSQPLDVETKIATVQKLNDKICMLKLKLKNQREKMKILVNKKKLTNSKNTTVFIDNAKISRWTFVLNN